MDRFTLSLSTVNLIIIFHQQDKESDGEALLSVPAVSSKTIRAISGTFGCTAGLSGGLAMSLRAADAFITPS